MGRRRFTSEGGLVGGGRVAGSWRCTGVPSERRSVMPKDFPHGRGTSTVGASSARRDHRGRGAVVYQKPRLVAEAAMETVGPRCWRSASATSANGRPSRRYTRRDTWSPVQAGTGGGQSEAKGRGGTNRVPHTRKFDTHSPTLHGALRAAWRRGRTTLGGRSRICVPCPAAGGFLKWGRCVGVDGGG